MKREEILKEELLRMRQLMGMNGSLYQKPIVGEHERHGDREPFGPGSAQPNPDLYKGGKDNPGYGRDFEHWRSHNPPRPSPPAPRPPAPRPPSPPSPPPAPSPKKGAKSTTGREGKNFTARKGTTTSKIGDGQYILPMGSIPKFGGGKISQGPSKGKGGKKGKKTKKKEK